MIQDDGELQASPQQSGERSIQRSLVKAAGRIGQQNRTEDEGRRELKGGETQGQMDEGTRDEMRA